MSCAVVSPWMYSLNLRLIVTVFPRTCIGVLLSGKSGDLLVLLGMKCSSWSRVNIGTSLRSICCPAGDLSKLSVTMANCMAARIEALNNLLHIHAVKFFNPFVWCGPSMVYIHFCVVHPWFICLLPIPWWGCARTILLIILVSALKATWLLEQPFQSMLRYYGRFRHLTYIMKVCVCACVGI